MLDDAWLSPKINIVEFVAFGGVGKSALVAEWLKRMQTDEYRKAARVFGHSFYSQGSRENAQASADSFLDQALRFFGDPYPTEGSPWDKGERLARLVRRQPTLLILDGVEPLQSPETTDDAGQIRDPGLQALIVELAARNAGLVVISTRARIKDIEGHRNSSVVSHTLDFLSTDAGTALLKEIGVTGTDKELGLAVEEVSGHALSVTLVGKYICHAEGGDIVRRFEIGLPRTDLVPAKPNELGKVDENDETATHNLLSTAVTPDVIQIGKTLASGNRRNRSHVAKTFSRIMRRYEIWLSGLQDFEGDVEVNGRLALELARLTGLFDRPITAGEFAAIVTGVSSLSEDQTGPAAAVESPSHGAIPGLTDLASKANEGEVNLAIGRLVEYDLITKVTDSRIRLSVPSWPAVAASEVVLDAHPLIREYFAGSLKSEDRSENGCVSTFNLHPSSFREAHRRLYVHLKQSTLEQPDDLNDTMPLYHAVAHGCAAALYEEAFAIYWERITLGDTFKTLRTCGWYGQDESAMNCFTDESGDVSPQVPLQIQALIRSIAAFCARARGDFNSLPQMIGGRQLSEEAADFLHAAQTAGYAAEMLWMTGDLMGALEEARRSVELADRSGNEYMKYYNRTTLADVYRLLGRRHESRKYFDEAEKQFTACDPTKQQLISLECARYSSLLLFESQFDEVIRRSRYALNQPNDLHLLGQARNSMVLGLAFLRRYLSGGRRSKADMESAQSLISTLPALFTRAALREDFPLPLVASAECNRVLQRYEDAANDLMYAIKFCKQYNLVIYRIDCEVELARLYCDQCRVSDLSKLLDKLSEETARLQYSIWIRDLDMLRTCVEGKSGSKKIVQANRFQANFPSTSSNLNPPVAQNSRSVSAGCTKFAECS